MIAATALLDQSWAANVPYRLDVIDSSIPKPPNDGKCRALALRGGGTKGAYEVGALKAFVELMQPIEYAYDVVVGVSIGAFNSAGLATFERGQEKAAVKFMEQVWSTNAVADFWDWWPFNIVEGLWRSSLLDVTKMR